MVRASVMLMAACLLAGTAFAAKVQLAPADDKPEAVFGARARAAHGPEPLAKPSADIGAADDPTPTQDPAAFGAPPPVPPVKVKPRG